MNPILEKILLDLVKRLLTEEVIKGAEAEVVAFFKSLAAKSGSAVDDYAVQVLASAWGVPY